jgi:hypothetical protein
MINDNEKMRIGSLIISSFTLNCDADHFLT